MEGSWRGTQSLAPVRSSSLCSVSPMLLGRSLARTSREVLLKEGWEETRVG